MASPTPARQQSTKRARGISRRVHCLLGIVRRTATGIPCLAPPSSHGYCWCSRRCVVQPFPFSVVFGSTVSAERTVECWAYSTLLSILALLAGRTGQPWGCFPDDISNTSGVQSGSSKHAHLRNGKQVWGFVAATRHGAARPCWPMPRSRGTQTDVTDRNKYSPATVNVTVDSFDPKYG